MWPAAHSARCPDTDEYIQTIPQDNVLASVLTKYQPHVLLAECFNAPVPLCCSSSTHAWGPAHCLLYLGLMF